MYRNLCILIRLTMACEKSITARIPSGLPGVASEDVCHSSVYWSMLVMESLEVARHTRFELRAGVREKNKVGGRKKRSISSNCEGELKRQPEYMRKALI